MEENDSAVRFVVLNEALSETGKIQCNLAYCSLDDPNMYAALSYTWGSPDITTPILLNGIEYQVTTNLAAVLERMRCTGYEGSALWIDALCINQQDILERNRQVQLMRKIYERASIVVIWLGEEGNNSELAMESLTFLSDWYIENKPGVETEESNRQVSQVNDVDAETKLVGLERVVAMLLMPEVLNAIQDLLRRP